MKLQIRCKEKVIFNNIRLASSTADRVVGLMFRKEIVGAEGLLIEPCNSIHTCFMRYPIDVVFISSKNQIVKVLRNVRPWRMTWIYFRAKKTLEVPAGKLPSGIREGDFLEIIDV